MLSKKNVIVRVHKWERSSHYAQIWSKKSADARNLKLDKGTVIWNQNS